MTNIYHVMQVNPAKFSKVNADGAKAFEDFMLSPAAQQIIANFGRTSTASRYIMPMPGKAGQSIARENK